MDDLASNDNKTVVKELFIDGHQLTICACNEHELGWSLSVKNEKGVSTNWHNFFPSASDAIDIALKTINEEGIEEFMGYEDFGYLYEDKET